jgi:hypothetical protein
MQLIIAVVLLVAVLYGFTAIRKRSSRRTKRIGLAVWLALGIAALIFGLLNAAGDIGVLILTVMVALFWVLPTAGLLLLDQKTIDKT